MTFKKTALLLLVFYLITGSIFAQNNTKVNGFQGDIYVNRFKDITVHTYVAKDDFLTNAHIFETKNHLIIHDVFQKKDDCLDFLKYIKSLKKEVKAIYISHEHDDHWLGLCYFKEYPVYATPSVINYIRKEGPGIYKKRQEQLGENLPAELNVSIKELLFEDEIIDGVLFRNFQINEGGPVYLELPHQKILVSHHMMPYGMHPIIPKDINGRIEQLKKIKTKNYKLLLAGHGKPATNENIDEFIVYLQKANSSLKTATHYEDVKHELVNLQPTWEASMLLDRSLPNFFIKAEHFPLNDLKGLELNGYKAKASNYQGLDCIEAYWDKNDNNESFIEISKTSFTNGTIELELLGTPGPYVKETSWTFLGLAFRIQNDSTYECIYIRPSAGRDNDMESRNFAVQYTSHPYYTWQVQKNESPGKYVAYYDLTKNSWTKIKIKVNGQKAELYINDSKQPVLLVNDLKMGENISGGVGLWVGASTLGRYRNLTITYN
ncbi:hypothetical protein ACE01N_04290 [Saccharicrinis sp. FJH2]|uniref:hypothetical protein n=1 Tax=Saccharicrinis sp. FJH65 TaxID=3344659 RepID=UPI0035F4B4AC